MQIKSRFEQIAVAGLAVACLMSGGCGKQTNAGASPGANLPEVSVVTVQPQKVTITSELPGRTSAYLVAEVRPQVNGIIQKRLFTEGGDIKAGEVLYQIDPATYQAAHESAKAALKKSEANVTTARLKAERYKSLVGLKAVSQQDCDEADGALKQADADVDSAKAALESARINLAYTRVSSPISGRIGKSAVTTGALVTANQGAALSTVQQLDPIYVDVTQSSAEMLRLRQSLENGQIKNGNGKQAANVRLFLEDGSEYPQKGVLKFSDVTVDQTTGSIVLRAVFPNPKYVLLPGMYVRAILEEGVNEQAILVPQQGVTRNPKGVPTALVLDGADKVEQRALKVARTIGDNWLVSDGLNPGDRVIVEGLQKVKPGDAVKVVSSAATANAGTTASADAKL